MLLLIDAGNTLIKWALVPAMPFPVSAISSWTASGDMPHEQMENLSANWEKHLAGRPLKRVLASNVAGPAVRDRLSGQIQALNQAPPKTEWFAAARNEAGVFSNYEDFSRLGSDRFASLVGARTLFPGENLVVVTCGTATTIDTLTADGIFIGGMILPGLRLMAASLVGNTALLPDIGQHTENIPPFATNTADAIKNGCMTAQAGAVEHAVTVHARRFENVRCLLSGGAARLVLPYLSIPAQIVDNLVLVGLRSADARKHVMDQKC